MPVVEYKGRAFALAEGETVLDALLRNDVKAAHSCKAGACHTCIMRVSSGAVQPKAQAGLKASWKAQGYFLPCICLPEMDLAIAPVGADAQSGATITGLRTLSPSVLELRIRCDSPIGHRAGQYITLMRQNGLARSYSIASLSSETELELHVRRISRGRMSGWVHEEARVGDRLTVTGPSGECFYTAGSEDQPLLLAGTGTGLAPLYGIVREALLHGHRGPIKLFHGALDSAGLYLVSELKLMARRHANFAYHQVVLNGTEEEGLIVGALDSAVFQRLPKLKGWRAFLCGDPALVQGLRKKIFLAGAASKDIFVDAFLPAAQAAAA